MYDYEEEMMKCRQEIRRLHAVCREKNDKINRLSALLFKAVVHIAETTKELNDCDTEEQLDWFRETLGITKYELSQIGVDWLGTSGCEEEIE